MPASPVVFGAECRQARAGCGDPARNPARNRQRMGMAKPTKLEICRQRDPRTASAKKHLRLAYLRILERALKRKFPDLTLMQLSNSVDLEKSFGPIYSRGLLKRGQSAFAVLGVNRQELQSSIDASLTFGILRLDVCRNAHIGENGGRGAQAYCPEELLGSCARTDGTFESGSRKVAAL